MSMTIQPSEQQEVHAKQSGGVRRFLTRQVPWDVLVIWLVIGLLLALTESLGLLTAPLARTVLMFPTLFVASGYVAILLLFPGRTHLTGLERVTFTIIIDRGPGGLPGIGNRLCRATHQLDVDSQCDCWSDGGIVASCDLAPAFYAAGRAIPSLALMALAAWHVGREVERPAHRVARDGSDRRRHV